MCGLKEMGKLKTERWEVAFDLHYVYENTKVLRQKCNNNEDYHKRSSDPFNIIRVDLGVINCCFHGLGQEIWD